MRIILAADHFMGQYLGLCIAGIVMLVGWLFLRPRFAPNLKHLSLASGQVINLLEGLLYLFAIVAILNVLRFAFGSPYTIDTSDTLGFIAYLLIHLAVMVTIARAIELFWLSRTNFVDEHYIPGLPRILLYGAAFLLGGIIFGISQGLSINGLYISTGAMAALIAFAMQRTLGDLFSGISLSVEHPFKIGDWIELEDGTQGEVRDLNWRATRLRGWDNSSLIVPNGKLAQQTFRNLHGKEHRYSPWYTVTLPREVDPRFAKSLMLEVALNCKRVLKSPLPVIRLVDTGTVPYQYMVWLHFANFQAMFAGREEFFRELHYAFVKSGIHSVPMAQDVRFFAGDKNSASLPSVSHALHSLDFSSMFNKQEMETMIERSYSVFADSGTTILKEGEIADSVYIVLNGLVETSVKDKKGKSSALKPLSSGEYFGLASMLTDAASFQTFTASSDVTLVQIDRKCFRDIASQRDELLEGFAEIVEQRMSRVLELRESQSKSEGPVRLRDVLERIERFVGGTS